jgi:hypothetical protein
MRNNHEPLLLILVFAAMLSCHRQEPANNSIAPLIPVKITKAFLGDIEHHISYYGKTVYQKKNAYVAPISGYISKIDITYGGQVSDNEELFVVQTKESKALKKSSNLENDYGFVRVLASSGGFVSQLNFNGAGDYVTEGTLVCVIAEDKDVMIQANITYADLSRMQPGMKCKLLLPDNSFEDAFVFRILPTVDATSQTQQVLVKPKTSIHLPENLNLIVQFDTTALHSRLLIAKRAVLTNETQTIFWVMKIINDSIAVKIPIIKGIGNDSIVEILSPEIDLNDLFITEGAYGLPDSAVVKIVK